MGVIVMILPVEEITAATLRVQVPEQHAETYPGQEAGQVDGCSGFANASLDIINGNFFQKMKLTTKPLWQTLIAHFFSFSGHDPVIIISKKPARLSEGFVTDLSRDDLHYSSPVM